MGRLLVLVVLIVIAAWLLRRALRRHEHSVDPRADAPAAKPAEELVRCARCGLLLPRGEARLAAGRAYCTEEHARLGPATR
jgi:uncharacterized protein